MTTIGYARVSTDGQTLAAQTEASPVVAPGYSQRRLVVRIATGYS
jgi:DNA invertase Pin-like site-specific DNA recombinase